MIDPDEPARETATLVRALMRRGHPPESVLAALVATAATYANRRYRDLAVQLGRCLYELVVMDDRKEKK